MTSDAADASVSTCFTLPQNDLWNAQVETPIIFSYCTGSLLYPGFILASTRPIADANELRVSLFEAYNTKHSSSEICICMSIPLERSAFLDQQHAQGLANLTQRNTYTRTRNCCLLLTTARLIAITTHGWQNLTVCACTWRYCMYTPDTPAKRGRRSIRPLRWPRKRANRCSRCVRPLGHLKREQRRRPPAEDGFLSLLNQWGGIQMSYLEHTLSLVQRVYSLDA